MKQNHPEIEADGEMQGDTALSEAARKLILPHSKLEGEANILIMPNLDTANVAYQMIKALADALPVGPILIGPARPAHILTPSVTARGILNMTAVAAVEAQERAGRQQPSLVWLARHGSDRGSGDQQPTGVRFDCLKSRGGTPIIVPPSSDPAFAAFNEADHASFYHFRANSVRGAVYLFRAQPSFWIWRRPRNLCRPSCHSGGAHALYVAARSHDGNVDAANARDCGGSLEVICGLMIALNFGARFFAILLILFVAAATFYFMTSGIRPAPTPRTTWSMR